jgi:CTP synthase
MLLHEQGLDEIVVDKLRLTVPPADLTEWKQVVAAKANPDGQVDIAMVGKYVQVKDSYISLNEALTHAGVKTRTRVNVHYIESTDIEKLGTHALSGMDAILVPGGFGERGIEGKIAAVRYARENKIPYLGICLGMQLAVIEYGRHVLGLENANSTEFNRATAHPVIALITEWQDAAKGEQKRDDSTGKGGTMRLGAQDVFVGGSTLARAIYGNETVRERHRHRYEFNNGYRDRYTQSGFRFSGLSKDDLVEIIELPGHPWFVATQFHPEFTSTPRDGHPLFAGFVKAARQHRTAQLPEVVSA